jgi:hypothetical protein
VLIHWIIIKEPNKFIKFDGAIYILLESAEEDDSNPVLKFFGYKKNKIEPRLHKLSYSRDLHERLEKRVMPRLRKGQPVMGKLSKGEGGVGRSGNEGKLKNKGGSESQKQEWHFHELRPSEIHRKPEK